MNIPDPFDHIVAGAGMGEWPEPGYETIPPYKIAQLQEALVEHLVAMGSTKTRDEIGSSVFYTQLQEMLEQDFERLNVVAPGDTLKVSKNGFLLCVEPDGSISCDLIDSGVYVEGTVLGPIVMPAPVMDAVVRAEGRPQHLGDTPITQISACIELTNVVVGSTNHEDGLSHQPLEVETILFGVPIVYEGTKFQRKL